jgi:hypothetical protein
VWSASAASGILQHDAALASRERLGAGGEGALDERPPRRPGCSGARTPAPASARRSAFTYGSTAARTKPSRSAGGEKRRARLAVATMSSTSRSSRGGALSSGMRKRPQRRARSPTRTRLVNTEVGTASTSAPTIGVTHQK